MAAAQGETTDTRPAPPVKRYARISPFYKALIWTSFVMNAILLIIVGVLVGFIITQRNQLAGLLTTTQTFAGTNVAELQDVVAQLEQATIVYTVPLDTRLPIEIDVPINQTTIVTLTEAVPLDVPASIIFPGVGNLNASSVSIQLPPGLRLPIALDFSVPLRTSVPVVLDVPVNIPLAETELGPQFQRLGAIVDRLVTPAEPLLIRPDTVPDSSAPRGPAAPAPAEPAPAPAQPAAPAPADPAAPAPTAPSP